MKTKFYFLAVFSVLFLFSCSEDSGDDGSETNIPVQPPVANFNIINDGCLAPCDILFESTSISSETPILAWDFGDGGSAGDVSSTSHTYDQAGYYEVKLTVQNAGGTDEITKQVFVDTDPVNTYTGVYISQFTMTLLPSNMPAGNLYDFAVTDDLGQVVSSGQEFVSSLPSEVYLSNSNTSTRVSETHTFTISRNGNSVSFDFIPSDYPPNLNSNCTYPNIVMNGIGLDLRICWSN